MADTKPTVGQAMSLREDAIAKGVTREQWQEGAKTLTTALDAIKSGTRLRAVPPISAPSWGRIHFVDGVTVQLDRCWRDAVNEAAPGSDRHATGIYDAQKHYVPKSSAVVKVNLVLVDLSGEPFERALTWAAVHDLIPASPRHVFALCAQHPEIHKQLNPDKWSGHSATIVSPIKDDPEYRFSQLCNVHFLYDRRTAYTHSAGCSKEKNEWIAFLRE